MKIKSRILLIVLAVLIMAVLFAIPVAAKVSRTVFSGIETTVDVLDWGEWNTLPSGRMQVRGWVLQNYDDTNDARTTGTNIVTINANWEAAGTGPFWGTFYLEPDAYDGYWEGNFTGVRPAEGCAPIKSFGHGKGQFEGQQITMWIEGCDDTSNIVGEILDPHGG